ncbi:hypothetical protein COW46_04505 [Candidatus Gracilibacteria bacterium CG17_big_fil_post_rev_8_21_14_2_50_48_13]|nr:MAG: hypothetical protein COW46_04505 [Candidatus Gracilibacteria bacterium CG17_big_fil_post_rev_8_21_14_2_50_48_13]
MASHEQSNSFEQTPISVPDSVSLQTLAHILAEKNQYEQRILGNIRDNVKEGYHIECRRESFSNFLEFNYLHTSQLVGKIKVQERTFCIDPAKKIHDVKYHTIYSFFEAGMDVSECTRIFEEAGYFLRKETGKILWSDEYRLTEKEELIWETLVAKKIAVKTDYTTTNLRPIYYFVG